jgi:hypothetical protein
MLAEGRLRDAKLSGYVETDFLSAGTTSNNNESNSYTLRQRQAWGQAALDSGWSVTGGQMWSLVTETKHGMDNRTEAVPMTIDPQYTVGFSWARQYGLRLVKNFDNKVWFGVSMENAQATVTSHNNGNNFLIGSAGAGGGLYNAASPIARLPSTPPTRLPPPPVAWRRAIPSTRPRISSRRSSSNRGSDTTRYTGYMTASVTGSFPAAK